jgi:hypothetical protein
MKRHPQIHTVEVEHNGIRHQGQYTVEGGVVEVTYGMARNSALSRNHPAEIEARRLLREILEGGHWKL